MPGLTNEGAERWKGEGQVGDPRMRAGLGRTRKLLSVQQPQRQWGLEVTTCGLCLDPSRLRRGADMGPSSQDP